METQPLADLLELPPDALAALCASAEGRYRRYPIVTPRKRRWIEAPDERLKAAQRGLLDRLLYRLPATAYAHGFVPGRSILTHARQHCGQTWVVRLDLADFFLSVTAAMVRCVAADLPLGDGDREVLVQLVTYRGRLPQGAPTSPHLANLVVRDLDVTLGRLAADGGWRYSRYADDLAFSGAGDPRSLLDAVGPRIAEAGFRVRRAKTRVMGRHQRQCVTGLVVNDRVTVPRPMRRRLRALLHRLALDGWESVQDAAPSQVTGRLAFIGFVMPEALDGLMAEFRALCEETG